MSQRQTPQRNGNRWRNKRHSGERETKQGVKSNAGRFKSLFRTQSYQIPATCTELISIACRARIWPYNDNVLRQQQQYWQCQSWAVTRQTTVERSQNGGTSNRKEPPNYDNSGARNIFHFKLIDTNNIVIGSHYYRHPLMVELLKWYHNVLWSSIYIYKWFIKNFTSMVFFIITTV